MILREAAERLTFCLSLQGRFQICLEAGVEGVLDPAEGARGHGSKVLGQVSRLFWEGFVGYYFVDQSYSVSFFDLHGIAEHAHLYSPSQADDAGQQERDPCVGHEPYLDKGNREFRVLCGDSQIARQCQPHAGPVDRTVQGGDDGLLDPDHPLYEPAVRVAQVFSEVRVSVSLLDDLRQVGAGGETAALAAQHDAADLFVFSGFAQSRVQLIVQRAVEGVKLLRAIHGDVGHPVVLFVEHGFVQLPSFENGAPRIGGARTETARLVMLSRRSGLLGLPCLIAGHLVLVGLRDQVDRDEGDGGHEEHVEGDRERGARRLQQPDHDYGGEAPSEDRSALVANRSSRVAYPGTEHLREERSLWAIHHAQEELRYTERDDYQGNGPGVD